MSVGERIRRIRKDAGLSLETFGEQIGITKSAVGQIERGMNNPAERTIKLICSEFRVNYDWLTQGIGEMYSTAAESIIDELVDEYHLDDLDRQIMIEYLKLPVEQRQIFRDTVRRMFIPADPQKEKTDDE